MDIFTHLPLDSISLPDTVLVDTVPPPLDIALDPLTNLMDMNQPSTDFTLPTVDTSPDFSQTQSQMDWNPPVGDWTPEQQDWSQPTTLVQDYHEHSIMPRSAAEAAKASAWADWHQANADKAAEWAKWDVEHNPDNLTHHLNEAAEAQAKADAKRQEALDELNKQNG